MKERPNPCPICGFHGVFVRKSGNLAICFCASCEHPRFFAEKKASDGGEA